MAEPISGARSNMSPNCPTDKIEAEASADKYGDYGTENYYGIVRPILVRGHKLKARISIHADNNHGWIYDTTHGD